MTERERRDCEALLAGVALGISICGSSSNPIVLAVFQTLKARWQQGPAPSREIAALITEAMAELGIDCTYPEVERGN